MNCRANGPAVYLDLLTSAGKLLGLWPDERLKTQFQNLRSACCFSRLVVVGVSVSSKLFV
ncbi:hypothetical protein Rcae01_02850 [Novipirellula caenicola]|uniref:Uncharacterized protein n=1 Tax=Novipirellula caenicola TaxID=1536901 RepID=A0ABP9VQF2_9BACT